MSKSTYVCKRCGCAVYRWGAEGNWKHATGGNNRSCRQKPVVMERQAYDEWMEQEVEGARAALKRFLGR